MIETKIICDGCGEEIDPLTSYAQEFYLQLSSVAKAHRGPSSFAMNKNYSLGPFQFHGLNCLGIYYHEKA